MPPPEAIPESSVQLEGATSPSPSCNELLGQLHRTVVRAALPVSETADGHGRPPSHWPTPRIVQSLTVAVSGHLIRSIPHHAVIAMQQRESFLSPSAQPSTLGHSSVTVQIPARPRTPASADHAVEHHILERSQISRSYELIRKGQP